MSVKSLNETYQNDGIFYFCNNCGDVNIPNIKPMSFHRPDELPKKQRDLYNNFLQDGCGCNMCVVSYAGEPAMSLGFLFDSCFCNDLVGHDATKEEQETFWDTAKEEAEKLSADAVLKDCNILLGKDTDPDGHEILVVVPYSRRADIAEIAKHLDDTVYADFEAAYLTEFETDIITEG